MYLELRMPLPVNVSPYFVISNPPEGIKDTENAQVHFLQLHKTNSRRKLIPSRKKKHVT